MSIDVITLGVYLVFLFVIGGLFAKYNKNLSDFIRGGGQATWWMVGASNTIAIISAYTFTGAASIAYRVGPTVLFVYLANVAGFFIGFLFLARWLRQTRAFTVADIIRERFGVAAEQFSAYLGAITGPIAAAIQLWALSIFASNTFHFPIIPLIILIGIVVVFYSTVGGRWAVLGTDFIQNLLIFGITILIAILAVIHIGGFGEFFAYFSDPRFAEDFKLVNGPDEFADGEFSLRWCIIVFILSIYYQISFTSAGRYLSVKDGREASRSALFATILTLIGTIVWFIPPMVARFMYETEINAMDLESPATASYTYLAQQVLPKGLMGILMAAMFAATMSSMDTGINAQVGNIARNIVPRIRKAFNKEPLSDRGELILCKVLSLCLGCLIITYSILFSLNQELELFQAFFVITSTIGIPMAFPLIVGLYVRRLSAWAYFFIVGSCIIPSIYSYVDNAFFGGDWSYQDRSLVVIISGIIATAVAWPFFKYSNKEFRKQLDAFFEKMHTPIDFAKEIGESRDYQQLVLIGNTIMVVGGAVLLLLFVPNDWSDRIMIIGLSAFFLVVGELLRWGARVEMRKDERLKTRDEKQ